MTFPKKAKILVTGGNGMIGQNLISVLVEMGVSDILSIDLCAGPYQGPASLLKYNIDISNREKIPRVIAKYKPNYVFHLAAHFANQNSVDNPFSDADTNINGVINMLGSLKVCPNLKKFVYASSSCVYSNSTSMSEDTPIYPFETPYAITKFAGELYTRFYADHFRVPTLSVRIFNTYGPGEYPGAYRNVIPNMLQSALLGKPIKITGDGEDSRDFTYVSDTVQLLIKAALSKYHQGEVFNGGTGHSTKICDLVNQIIHVTGSKSKIKYVKQRSWDHVKKRVSDISRSQKCLGYIPVIDLQTGLLATSKWLIANSEK